MEISFSKPNVNLHFLGVCGCASDRATKGEATYHLTCLFSLKILCYLQNTQFEEIVILFLLTTKLSLLKLALGIAVVGNRTTGLTNNLALLN